MKDAHRRQSVCSRTFEVTELIMLVRATRQSYTKRLNDSIGLQVAAFSSSAGPPQKFARQWCQSRGGSAGSAARCCPRTSSPSRGTIRSRATAARATSTGSAGRRPNRRSRRQRRSAPAARCCSPLPRFGSRRWLPPGCAVTAGSAREGAIRSVMRLPGLFLIRRQRCRPPTIAPGARLCSRVQRFIETELNGLAAEPLHSLLQAVASCAHEFCGGPLDAGLHPRSILLSDGAIQTCYSATSRT